MEKGYLMAVSEAGAQYYLQYYNDQGCMVHSEPFIPNDGVHQVPGDAAFVRLKVVDGD